MEAVKRERTALRTAFTKALTNFKSCLEDETSNNQDREIAFCLLEAKIAELDSVHERHSKLLYSSNDLTDEQIEKVIEKNDEYKSSFLAAKTKFKNLIASDRNESTVNIVQPAANPVGKKMIKYPTMEMPKFTGSVKEWLPFWSVYEKVHKDNSVTKEDKFQLLRRCAAENSRAYELIYSYPPVSENYDKVIASLKGRFGRDDLVIEFYVRELLTLVLQNAIKGNKKSSLTTIYDKVDSYIRALETLGVTTDKCAAMLYPLVESSLPEDVLRAWQRSGQRESLSGQSEREDRLKKLLEFLRTEVESQEQIDMALTGFEFLAETEKTKKIKGKADAKHEKKVDEEKEVATASVLLVTKDKKDFKCIFCSSHDHESSNCVGARKLSLEKRREIVKNENCCFRCLRRNHSSKNCNIRIKCAWCTYRHSILMCNNFSNKNENSLSEKKAEKIEMKEHNLAVSSKIPDVVLQTLKVKLYSEKFEKIVRIIIDSGSQRSYIRTSVAKELGYVPQADLEVTHHLFGGVTSKNTVHDIFLIRMKSIDESYACNFSVLSQDVICDTVAAVDHDNCISNFEKKNNVVLSDVGKSYEIDVLIGADVAGKLLNGNKCELENGLTAVGTHLGWTVLGKIERATEKRELTVMLTSMLVQAANISDLWKLDVLGITDPIEKLSTLEKNARTRAFLTDTLKVSKEGRFEVKLPFVYDHAPVPSNYQIAISRLKSTRTKLLKQKIYNDYENVFRGWLEEGIIEVVPENEVNNFGHYLPHRPVIKLNSTTTIRPVFDASASEKDKPALNNCLEKGENLIELVPSSLNRFREDIIGVVSDIKKAFLQVGISLEDRDFLRFLWEFDGELKILRHCRLVFGLSCSPCVLAVIIDMVLDKAILYAEQTKACFWSAETVLKLKRAFYVDNCVTSVRTEKELKRFIAESVEIMKTGSFELRGWEYTKDGANNSTTLVLGIKWNKARDTLSINPEALNVETPVIVTKRTVLAAANKVFDPIGFSCPVTLAPKILLAKLWIEKIDWDTPLEEKYRQEFLDWSEKIPVLNEIELDRSISEGALSIHVFVDASAAAYAAVVYARVENGSETKINLLSAKSRIAPKNTTIPRLELMGATIGVRLAKSTIESLTRKVTKIFYWTDSTVVLAWISRSLQWGVFVYNRVTEIREYTKTDEWCYVQGKQNPADLASRGCTPEELVKSQWWLGPNWLYQPPMEWPNPPKEYDEDKINSELKKSTIQMTSYIQIEKYDFKKHFSSYIQLIRFSAWVRRFLNNCKNKTFTKDEKCKLLGERKKGDLKKLRLSYKEYRSAEVNILKHLQGVIFYSNDKNQLSSFKTFQDENGLIVLKTKIFYRKDDFSFMCPILLGDHEIVTLLIRETHEMNSHAGSQILMNILRDRFWIISLRKLIRSVISKCQVCKRQNVKALTYETPPLPYNRVRDASIFEVIGIDYAGPLILKGGDKAWICLFTCAVYRAVHLELTSSLSTESFIECLRRFIARRGRPSIIYTDNAKNFEGTSNALDSLDWEKISKYSLALRIQWYFNPPSAPWWGGWWERLIGTLKVILRKVLGKASVSYEIATTILCDAEAIINSRPLTYMSEDSSDLKPLSPALFLKDIEEIGVPDFDMLSQGKLIKKLKYTQKIMMDLRSRFRKEYLGQLLLKNSKSDTRELKIGDVVLIGDDNHKRIDWPLARVLEIIKGRDGKNRVYILKTEKGVLRRPAQRVYPLEVSLNDKTDIPNVCQESIDTIKRKVDIKTKRCYCNKKSCNIMDCEASKQGVNASKIDSKIVTTRSGRVSKKPKRFTHEL